VPDGVVQTGGSGPLSGPSARGGPAEPVGTREGARAARLTRVRPVWPDLPLAPTANPPVTELPRGGCLKGRRRGLDHPQALGTAVLGIRSRLVVHAEGLGEGQSVTVRRRLIRERRRRLRPSLPEPQRSHASRLRAARKGRSSFIASASRRARRRESSFEVRSPGAARLRARPPLAAPAPPSRRLGHLGGPRWGRRLGLSSCADAWAAARSYRRVMSPRDRGMVVGIAIAIVATVAAFG